MTFEGRLRRILEERNRRLLEMAQAGSITLRETLRLLGYHPLADHGHDPGDEDRSQS